jgi:UDP:flavonoid glycosyltransferase YjiC (YdhE family)
LYGRRVRVLVTTVPAPGHRNPVVPLARGLRDAGHSVVWATAEPLVDGLRAEGFVVHRAGPPFAEWRALLDARTRGRPGDGIRPERTTQWFAPRLFGEIGAALLVDDLLAIARDVGPDVIVFDSRCYAAPAVARVLGALPVHRAVTTLYPTETEGLVSEAVTPLWRELGLEAPVFAGIFDGLTFSTYPAVLDDPAPYPGLTVHRLRPVAADEPEPPWLASWLRAQDGRPLVYATLGTVFRGSEALLRGIVDALDGLDVAVLLTVGPAHDPARLRSPSDRVRVESYVPQDAVLPYCALVLSHAGSGTLLGALANGVPHVAIPQAADQFLNARNVELHGFGRALLPSDVSPDAIRDVVTDVLAGRHYRRSAERIRDVMAAGMRIADAVTLIEAVA